MHREFSTQAAALLILAAPIPALAGTHDPAPPSDSSSSAEDPPVQEQARRRGTVVTARRWDEFLIDVPASVTVVSAEELERAGMRSVRDASIRVPNLSLTEFSSRRLSFPFLRGVGSGQGEPAVATYVDGVPQLTAGSTNLPLIDLERIEFLRGPQGALYGRNTLGGAIHLITKRPSKTAEFGAAVTAGNFGLAETSLSWSGPIADEGFYLSLSGQFSRRDGYTKNDFTGDRVDGREAFFGRAQVLVTPDEDNELRLTVYGEQSRDGGFVLSDLAGLRARPHRIDQNFEGVAERDLISHSLQWRRFGESIDFTSITSFQDWDVLETSDFDFSSFDAVRRRTMEDQEYLTQELRFSSAEDAPIELGERASLKWQAGVSGYVSEADRSAANDFRVPPPAVGIDTNAGVFDDYGVGIFGEATLTAWDDLDVSAGVRLDHERREADLRHTFVTGGVTVLDVSSNFDDEFGEVLPVLGSTWRVTEEVNLYGRAAKGFKAGGINLTAPAGEEVFDPEESWTYEVGLKTSFFDGRVGARLAGFYIDWDEMQLSLFDPAAGGYIDNAGRSNSKGFEFELDAEVCEMLSMFGTYGLTDTEFEEFTDSFGNNVSGNSLPFAPESTWSVGSELSGDLPRESTWYARVEYAGIGTFYYDADNTTDESYELVNLRAGVAKDGWSLFFWVRNLFEEEYFPVAFQPNPADPTLFVGESGEPRTFGVSLSAKF